MKRLMMRKIWKRNDFIRITDCKVQNEDFVLTKFTIKNPVVYYVAEIVTALCNTDEVRNTTSSDI